MPLCSVNSCNFYYELHGDKTKPALVLISGFTADHTMWLRMINKLSQNFHVLLFDNQGVGRTQDANQSLTISMMANNIFSLMKSLELQNPIIIGYAMGGTIAQEVAINHSENLSRIILINSVAKWSDFAIEQVNKLYQLRKNNSFEEMLPLMYQVSFSSSFKETYPLEKYITDKLGIMSSQPQSKQSLEGQYRQLQALVNFDSRDRLSKITIPTNIIASVEDTLATVADGEYLRDHIDDTSLNVLAYGHGIFVEAPSDLLEMILRLI